MRRATSSFGFSPFYQTGLLLTVFAFLVSPAVFWAQAQNIAVEYKFENNLEGWSMWTCENQYGATCGWTPENCGVMKQAYTDPGSNPFDPFIYSPGGLGLDMMTHPYVAISLNVTGTSSGDFVGGLYLFTSDWSEVWFLPFTFRGGSQVLTLDTANNAYLICANYVWITGLNLPVDGVVDHFRIDIPNSYTYAEAAGAVVEIDWIAVTDDPSYTVDPCVPAETPLVWSSYLGGTYYEEAITVKAGPSGNTYVGGRTQSYDFPTSSGSVYDPSYNGGDDGFVAVFDTTGSTLLWSTFLGGSGGERVSSIVVDPETGDVYLAGYTNSSNFPTTDGSSPTGYDIYVAKLDASGENLLFSTVIGGDGLELLHDQLVLAMDTAGYLYVVGNTESSNFPTTPGAYDTVRNGANDAFLVKLAPDGSPVYSTLLGGNGAERPTAVVVAESGEVYIAGWTSGDFPVTAGAYRTVFGGVEDAFVTKFNPSLAGLVYSTYLGGGGQDRAHAIAVNGLGQVYLTGWTGSSDFPTTPGAYDVIAGGEWEAFCTNLNASGSGLLGSTFLGGSDRDVVNDIVLDTNGNVWLSGNTLSPDFGAVTPEAFDLSFNGNWDCFVVQLNAALTSLLYGTFLGTDGDEGDGLMDVAASGTVRVFGRTPSFAYPTTLGAYQEFHDGVWDNPDTFVTILDIAPPDVTPPTFQFDTTAPEPTSVAPIPVTVTFSEPIVGFTVADVVPTNATVGSFVTSTPGLVYTFALTPTAQNVLVEARIPAGSVTDLADNPNAAGPAFRRTYQPAPPPPSVVSMNRFYPATSPTNVYMVVYQVIFSQPVTGVDVTDFDVATSGATPDLGVFYVNALGNMAYVFVQTRAFPNYVADNGSLQLHLDDDDSIVNGSGIPLGGPGPINGDAVGQVYVNLPYP